LQVSFTDEDVASGAVYNYKDFKPYGTEMPGASVFVKNERGEVFHTYTTCYSRGIDILNGDYDWLDLTPKEAKGTFPMAWVNRRDEYED
jgi:predicted dithiol-disulfide oxidoreductase (DUF899 family)